MNHNKLQIAQYKGSEFRITLNKRGQEHYIKQRGPTINGIYCEIETQLMRLQFNLNHEIVRAQGRDQGWNNDLEYLKRTAGNDWVYYSTGGYSMSWDTLIPIRINI